LSILRQLFNAYRKLDQRGRMSVDYNRAWHDHPEWQKELGADTSDGYNALSFIVRAWGLKGKLTEPSLAQEAAATPPKLGVALRNAVQRISGAPEPIVASPVFPVPLSFKLLTKAQRKISANNWARVSKGKDRMPQPIDGKFLCPWRLCPDFIQAKDFG